MLGQLPPQPQPHKIAEELDEKAELTVADYQWLRRWAQFSDWLVAHGDRSGPS